jgi:hypothetical protein
MSDPMFTNIIDATVERGELLSVAEAQARRLAAMPGFSLVKAQYRRATRARLAALLECRDPLLDLG